MRAVVVRSFGSYDDAAIENVQIPVPGPGEVLVEVQAAPVNFVDLIVIAGQYQFLPPLPFTPGKGPAGIVRALGAALTAEQRPAPIEGLACWTDAALLTAAGVPAICFGPGDIALAHAAEEYVQVEEIEIATRVLTRLALDWCGVVA